MELYKGKYWDVIFVDWCQEFPGYCIISSNKESLSKSKVQKDIFTKEEIFKMMKKEIRLQFRRHKTQ